MARIYDISMLIEYGMPVYKNKEEKRPVLINVRHHEKGKICESRLETDLHCGTHLDAPLHIIPGGSTVEQLEISGLLRECKVLDFTAVPDRITRKELMLKYIETGDFILLKTRNSYATGFSEDFIYLEKSGALYLAEKGVSGVGIDSLGIERDQADYDTHRILFSAGIYILEGLRLAQVEEGGYFLTALPLKIKGAEAAPVRAVLSRPD